MMMILLLLLLLPVSIKCLGRIPLPKPDVRYDKESGAYAYSYPPLGQIHDFRFKVSKKTSKNDNVKLPPKADYLVKPPKLSRGLDDFKPLKRRTQVEMKRPMGIVFQPMKQPNEMEREAAMPAPLQSFRTGRYKAHGFNGDTSEVNNGNRNNEITGPFNQELRRTFNGNSEILEITGKSNQQSSQNNLNEPDQNMRKHVQHLNSEPTSPAETPSTFEPYTETIETSVATEEPTTVPETTTEPATTAETTFSTTFSDTTIEYMTTHDIGPALGFQAATKEAEKKHQIPVIVFDGESQEVSYLPREALGMSFHGFRDMLANVVHDKLDEMHGHDDEVDTSEETTATTETTTTTDAPKVHVVDIDEVILIDELREQDDAPPMPPAMRPLFAHDIHSPVNGMMSSNILQAEESHTKERIGNEEGKFSQPNRPDYTTQRPQAQLMTDYSHSTGLFTMAPITLSTQPVNRYTLEQRQAGMGYGYDVFQGTQSHQLPPAPPKPAPMVPPPVTDMRDNFYGYSQGRVEENVRAEHEPKPRSDADASTWDTAYGYRPDIEQPSHEEANHVQQTQEHVQHKPMEMTYGYSNRMQFETKSQQRHQAGGMNQVVNTNAAGRVDQYQLPQDKLPQDDVTPNDISQNKMHQNPKIPENKSSSKYESPQTKTLPRETSQHQNSRGAYGAIEMDMKALREQAQKMLSPAERISNYRNKQKALQRQKNQRSDANQRKKGGVSNFVQLIQNNRQNRVQKPEEHGSNRIAMQNRQAINMLESKDRQFEPKRTHSSNQAKEPYAPQPPGLPNLSMPPLRSPDRQNERKNINMMPLNGRPMHKESFPDHVEIYSPNQIDHDEQNRVQIYSDYSAVSELFEKSMEMVNQEKLYGREADFRDQVNNPNVPERRNADEAEKHIGPPSVRPPNYRPEERYTLHESPQPAPDFDDPSPRRQKIYSDYSGMSELFDHFLRESAEMERKAAHERHVDPEPQNMDTHYGRDHSLDQKPEKRRGFKERRYGSKPGSNREVDIRFRGMPQKGPYDVPRETQKGPYDVPRETQNGPYDVPRETQNGPYDVPRETQKGPYDVPREFPRGPEEVQRYSAEPTFRNFVTKEAEKAAKRFLKAAALARN